MVDVADPGYNKHAARMGLQPPGQIESAANIFARNNASYIRGERGILKRARRDTVEHDPGARPQLLAVIIDEIERGLRDRHHHIDAEPLVFLDKQGQKFRLVLLPVKALPIERL